MNSLQRRKERRNWLRIAQHKIDNDEYGAGIFSTPYIMDGKAWWMDFRFNGVYESKDVMWSTALSNMQNIYIWAVEEIAYDEMEQKFPRKREEYSDIKDYIDAYNKEDYEWAKQRKIELANSGDIFVTEKIEIHPEYKFSVGLHANVNIGLIGPEQVIQFIEDFKKSGYKEFQGTEKFSYTWKELENLNKE